MIVLICIILVGLIGIGGFFYWSKNQSKKEQIEEKVEEDKTEPLTETQQEYLLNKISFYDGMLPYSSFSSKELSFEKAIQFIESIKQTEYVDFTKGVTIKRINEILNRYFGPEASLSIEKSCTDPALCYFYEEEKESYIKQTPTSDFPIQTKNIFVEGTRDKETGKIVVQVKQLYSQKKENIFSVIRYFRSYEEAMADQNPAFDLEALYGDEVYSQYHYYDDLEKAIQSVVGTLPTQTYTFQYQSGGYYLESVVK